MNKTKFILFTASLVLATTLTLSCEDKEKDKPATVAETASVAETAAPPTEAAKAPSIPDPIEGAFTDSRDGKKYKSLKIGEQVWMAENLNYKTKGGKCFGEGGKVVQTFFESDETEKKTLSKAEVQDNCTKHGRLYNWETAKKSCPKDWHLPSYEEWQTLVNFAGGQSDGAERLRTDKYGFSDTPCCGEADGSFVAEAISGGNWWSSSKMEDDGKSALGYYIGYASDDGRLVDFAHNIFKDKSSLLYVRCVEDSEEYRAKAAAKSKALEETIIKTIKAWQSKDEKTLNQLLLKDFGIAFLSRPGIYTVISMSDKISFDNHIDFKTDYKIRYEKLPVLSCKEDEKEDSGWKQEWNKPSGIYCDTTSTGGPLSGNAKACCGDWSAEQIRKFEEIDENSYQITVVDGVFVFYLTFIENQWYLTVIDRYDFDCGGT